MEIMESWPFSYIYLRLLTNDVLKRRKWPYITPEPKIKRNKSKKVTRKVKKKVKRGRKKSSEKFLNIFSTNAAQLKGKLDSFKSELKLTNAAVFTVQETHYPVKGKFMIEDYEIFEAIRKKEKGGTMVGVHSALQPVLVQEYSEEFELLVVEVKINKKEIRNG